MDNVVTAVLVTKEVFDKVLSALIINWLPDKLPELVPTVNACVVALGTNTGDGVKALVLPEPEIACPFIVNVESIPADNANPQLIP